MQYLVENKLYNTQSSFIFKKKTAVPQCSTLGPILFIVLQLYKLYSEFKLIVLELWKAYEDFNELTDLLFVRFLNEIYRVRNIYSTRFRKFFSAMYAYEKLSFYYPFKALIKSKIIFEFCSNTEKKNFSCHFKLATNLHYTFPLTIYRKCQLHRIYGNVYKN